MADAEPVAATPREIQILETPEDIQARREQVLGRYAPVSYTHLTLPTIYSV